MTMMFIIHTALYIIRWSGYIKQRYWAVHRHWTVCMRYEAFYYTRIKMFVKIYWKWTNRSSRMVTKCRAKVSQMGFLVCFLLSLLRIYGLILAKKQKMNSFLNRSLFFDSKSSWNFQDRLILIGSSIRHCLTSNFGSALGTFPCNNENPFFIFTLYVFMHLAWGLPWRHSLVHNLAIGWKDLVWSRWCFTDSTKTSQFEYRVPDYSN